MLGLSFKELKYFSVNENQLQFRENNNAIYNNKEL